MMLYLRPDALQPGLEAVTAAPAARPRRKKSASQVKAGQNLGTGQIVLFPLPNEGVSAGTLLAGLSIAQVCEVTESIPIVKVPRAPGFVLGLVDWRHRPFPCSTWAGVSACPR